MRVVKVVLFTLIFLVVWSFQGIAAKDERDKMLGDSILKEWVPKAVEVLRLHFTHHPGCDLTAVDDSLESAYFYVYAFQSRTMRAYAVGEQGKTQKIFINSLVEWDLSKDLPWLIHEGTHITFKNGRQLCGPDVTRTLKMNPTPACRLFGQAQFTSREITDAISEHLKADLKGVQIDGVGWQIKFPGRMQ